VHGIGAAAQIKAEAVKLLQPHGSNIGVHVWQFCKFVIFQ
jgi:hypothetical protein